MQNWETGAVCCKRRAYYKNKLYGENAQLLVFNLAVHIPAIGRLDKHVFIKNKQASIRPSNNETIPAGHSSKSEIPLRGKAYFSSRQSVFQLTVLVEVLSFIHQS
jgi:hypothetical protein